MNNGRLNNNNKTNTNIGAVPFYENDMKRNNADWLPFDDFWKAYIDCKKRKRHTRSCAEFEFNEVSNLYGLWRDLNNHTYEIGNSIAFAVTRPKLREIFAADFRDRIVHHKTYAIRWRLWNAISDDLKKYLYITDMCTLKVRKKYKLKYKLLEQYGSKRNLRKRKLLHKQKGVWYVGRSSKTA